MTKDLTSGNIWKVIGSFTFPILVGGLFQQFYNLVDAIIVGRFLGEEALGSITNTGPLSFLIVGFAVGVSNGFAVVIAQKFGSNNIEAMKKAIGNSIVLSLLVGVFLTVLALSFSGVLLNAIHTPSNFFSNSKGYIDMIYLGIIASIFYNLISAILRSVGNSLVPLLFLILASVINILLDLFFIAVLGFGPLFAGLATAISQMLSAVLGFVYAFKKYPILRIKKNDFQLDKNIALLQLKIGLPMAFQFSITAIGSIIVQGALNNLTSTVSGAHITGYGTAIRIEQLVTQPFIAIAVAMSSYCGQNYGARNYQRLKDGVFTALKMALIYSVLAILISRFFAVAFIGLFLENPSNEIIYYTETYIQFSCYFYPFLATLLVFRNSLQGMGDSIYPTLGGILELLARIIVSLVLPMAIGYFGVCIASPSAWIVTSLMLIIRMFFFLKAKSKDPFFVLKTQS